MGLSHELVGPKILAKIQIYILTRVELLFTLCSEIPCNCWKRITVLWSGYLIFINVGKSFYLITFVHEATIISDWLGIKGEGKVEIRIWSFLFLLSCSFWFQYEIRFYNLTLVNLSEVQTSAREFSHGQKSWLLALT